MNTNKKGFGLAELIVRIILIALFVLLFIWLFRNYSPNMKPFYSNIFRENVSYMQNAAKSYFTNDKLPTEVGKSVRLTLGEMEEMKLLIPFVDKDGKSCNKKDSYAEITKEEVGYTLKVNLVCGKESNYIIDILGCHEYCNECESQQTIEYEFEREISKNVTTFTCPSGYTKKDKVCTKKTGTETIAATAHYTKERKEKTDPLYTTGQGQTIEVAVVVTETSKVEKEYIDPTINTTVTKTYTDVNKKDETTKVYTDPQTSVTQNCHDVRIKDPNCTVQCKWEIGSDGIPKEVCNTCGYVIHQECTDETAYFCPNNYITEGSGASTACYRNVTTTTYSCPSGYTKEGSGENTKCYKNVTTTTYSCASGYTKEGSGANTKCYKNVTKITKKYSCPSDATSDNGQTGSKLRCYKYIAGEKIPYCENPKAALVNGKCVLTIPSEFSHYTCPSSAYTLNSTNGTCKKDTYETIKATETTKVVKSKETKWSTSKVLEGWTFTGRTRTAEAK